MLKHSDKVKTKKIVLLSHLWQPLSHHPPGSILRKHWVVEVATLSCSSQQHLSSTTVTATALDGTAKTAPSIDWTRPNEASLSANLFLSLQTW
ncbi:hypothetical protein V6N11_080433 [Hibiscus sabdariffa]|uniref:Uncharacterized protein n=1 Tax=Hibiscus sabdariffa TaxID=183260 RepID=A0ABR2R7R1_9ROSI